MLLEKHYGASNKSERQSWGLDSQTTFSILRKQKYEVDAAYDGEEGLDFALSGIYDVIFDDGNVIVPNGQLKIVATDLSKNPKPEDVHLKNNTSYSFVNLIISLTSQSKA